MGTSTRRWREGENKKDHTTCQSVYFQKVVSHYLTNKSGMSSTLPKVAVNYSVCMPSLAVASSPAVAACIKSGTNQMENIAKTFKNIWAINGAFCQLVEHCVNFLFLSENLNIAQ